jgi:hypothetical protein
MRAQFYPSPRPRILVSLTGFWRGALVRYNPAFLTVA